MNPRLMMATAVRVLRQLKADPRTIALLLVVPCVLIGLFAWVVEGSPLFDQVGGPLLGIFPFVVMFIVTSIATLRERTSGTLERLLSMPLGQGDFLGGYAIAFGFVAIVQSVLVTAFAVYVAGLDITGSAAALVLTACLSAVVGTALGLLASAFAKTEFQAVQFMPALVLPQFLICGLIVPRDQMPGFLEAVSNVIPMSYVVDAMNDVVGKGGGFSDIAEESVILVAFTLGSLLLGALTLRRRTA